MQILDGSTLYEGRAGKPTAGHINKGPGEWLSPTATGTKSIVMGKGDMLVIPAWHTAQAQHRGLGHLHPDLNARRREELGPLERRSLLKLGGSALLIESLGPARWGDSNSSPPA